MVMSKSANYDVKRPEVDSMVACITVSPNYRITSYCGPTWLYIQQHIARSDRQLLITSMSLFKRVKDLFCPCLNYTVLVKETSNAPL